jgi:hypothetical protein
MPYEGLKKDQLKSLVQRTRRGEIADWEGLITSFPLVNCSDCDERLFLQFNVNVNIAQKMQKLIGFSHPDLIHNLKYGPVHLFVDCTFSCVPKGFSQCLVIMAHDKSTSTYVPIFYVLMQSKLEMAYKHALRMCVAATDDKMEITNATCDFERGIINALKAQFNKPIVGCIFHWKQALRRRLLEYNVGKDKISELVGQNGLINLLTVIPIAEIENKGIPYIRENFNEGLDKNKFDMFWKYFVATWMGQQNPEHWNIHKRCNDDFTPEDILNRTNNPLERFNRKLNGHFGAGGHPTMVQFVTGIRALSMEYADLLKNIRRGHSQPATHEEATVYSVPSDYAAFKSSTAVAKGRYAQLSEFRFLTNSCHYDPLDKMLYRITKVEWWEKSKGDWHIVAHRSQCRWQHGYCIDGEPFEDFISVEEAMEYTGIPTAPQESSPSSNDLPNSSSAGKKRQRSSSSCPQEFDLTEEPADEDEDLDDDGRVHCRCPKRGGGYCLAKLSRASPTAEKYPNAMYWSCNKRNSVKCDFWRLARPNELSTQSKKAKTKEPEQLPPVNMQEITCSRCQTVGHFARYCPNKNA